jgi:hypothetical protein
MCKGGGVEDEVEECVVEERHYTTRYLAEILVVDVRVLPPLDNFSLCETGPGKCLR